jgi:hypothetical protein
LAFAGGGHAETGGSPAMKRKMPFKKDWDRQPQYPIAVTSIPKRESLEKQQALRPFVAPVEPSVCF